MTAAVLISPPSIGTGRLAPRLDAELAALLAGIDCECLVCGTPVEVDAAVRVKCGGCGCVLEPAAGADGQRVPA